MAPKKNITIKTPAQFFASGFGSGCAPFAPGTFGTIAAIPLWYISASLLSPLPYCGLIILLFFIGIPICTKASAELQVHDHGGIVWDEFVGFMVTMIAIPITWSHMLLGFVLFRFFDIIKPWPIKWVDQKVSGGFGIMMDDLLAGIFALISFHGILYGYAKFFL